MWNVRTFGALLLFGCAPSSPADSVTPDAVHTQRIGPRPSAQPTSTPAVSHPPPSEPLGLEDSNVDASTTLGAASPTPTTSPAAGSLALLPKAPGLESLNYHALPQTHLGFYGVLTPPGYDAPENATRRYPVVVILHGSGSNEVVHGSLADDIGREDVIYVLPRAPHPSPEQFAAGKEGYTAWPSYPAQWGDYGSPDFPREEVDKLQVHKFYTRWIADSLLDARLRYRVTAGRAVVVGHSQGATFAHLFAADYPALVKAYVAYAGPSRLAVKSPDGKRQMTSLRNAGVVPLLIHREADAVVDVTNTKLLDAMMTEQGVKHTTHVLPGGSHATDPEVRRLLRAFTREQCCGKERTTADVPVGSNGTLSVSPIKDIVTFGPESCTERVSALSPCANPTEGNNARCELYEAEPCGNRSFGYRSTSFECVNSVWTRVSKAPAECGVQRRDPEVGGCNVQLFRTRPSEHSKTDACDLVLRCSRVQTVVTCDGENDGTATSLCECTRGGTSVTLPQSVYSGESPQSCIAAAQQCLTRH